MRSLRLAVLPILVATSLAAQAPAPAETAAPPARVSPRRTAFVDVAALVDSRQRFGLEPLVFGRWAVGLVGSHTRSTSAQQVPYLTAVPLPIVPCPSFGCGSFTSSTGYNAWSLDLALRYYPAALSFNDPRRRFMVYVGEFIGYHQRMLEQPYYPPVPLVGPGSTIPCPASTSPQPYPCGPMPGPVERTTRLTGWEPGGEVGMRLMPLDPLFIDVGGWFKLVTIDDPMQRIRPGQLDARLVVAVGVGW